jgi:hypothetical protein
MSVYQIVFDEMLWYQLIKQVVNVLSVCRYVQDCMYANLCLSVCQSVCLSLYMYACACLYVCLSVCPVSLQPVCLLVS